MKQILPFLLLVATACSPLPYRNLATTPELGKEIVPPEEGEALDEILSLVAKGYAAQKPGANRPYGRIIHHKEHGCLKAEFQINKNLPPGLKHGIFSQEENYPAWVRVSNGSGQRQHDAVPDGRGLAIKLMNVEGEKLGDEQHTQDFLLQNAPFFFSKDVAGQVKFMKQAAAPGFKGIADMLKDMNLKDGVDRESLKLLALSSDNPAHPLTAKYFSALPQKFGNAAMKLHARGCDNQSAPESTFSGKFKKDFLKTVLKEHLDKKDACIELFIQVQVDAIKMPIENGQVKWDEKLSPFRSVAKILIPKQNFLSEKRQEFCENLSFNPWNTIQSHRPLGGLNRARKHVYEHSQKYRHLLNNQKKSEPIAGDSHE